MLFSTTLSLLLATGAIALNVQDEGDSFIVDTGSPLVVTFEKDTCDMTSIQYSGVEYQHPVDFSHLASGLGSGTTVEYETIDDSLVVSCVVSSDELDLTQYHVFQNGSSTIYLGTDTVTNPAVGELRFIFRLQGLEGAYPSGNVSDTRNGEVIESEDIYIVGDETRAKHYSAERYIDDQIHCAFGDIYACFIKPIRGYEASTGGPFYRDIRLNLQEDKQDSSYYMNHGDYPWDPVRTGFHGPFIFTFEENLPDPSQFDYQFIENLGLEGYVGDSERGTVVGETSGTSSDFPTVVHWYNDDYQQWVYAEADGSFESPLLIPGNYTQAFYQDELLAGTTTVIVEAGATATADITATNPIITENRTTVFQLGDFDGRPTGFLNADKQPYMHVSDPRMGAWDTPPFVVGTNSDAEFPMAIFMDVNNDREIEFDLEDDITTAAKFRVGTTLAFYYGEPTIAVNGYVCPDFENPIGSEGRGITKGMTHGDMTVYECEIPEGTLTAGSNNATLGVTASKSGSEWLSPNYILDFVELYY